MGKITVRSDTGYRTAINIREHTLFADEPLPEGGTDTGPTPMEMLLGSIGACVAITVRLYAERKGWSLENVTIELAQERFKASDYPSYHGDAIYVTEIRENITFEGDLTDEQRKRLLDIAQKCPVHRTLENPVMFVHSDFAE